MLAVALALLAFFWNWDWFIPIVDSRVSAALGRKVTIQHLHARLGGPTEITLSDITIGNPKGFGPGNLATIDRLTIDVKLWHYILHRQLTLTKIEVDHPVVNLRQKPDGTNNYTIAMKHSGGGASPKIGMLVIKDGHADVKMAKYKTDMDVAIHTGPAPKDSIIKGREVAATAKGTYDGQPITGSFQGGALLSLRDKSNPYPVDLHVANGSTKVSLVGTIQQPMSFGGASLKLSMSGQNLANLYKLTAIPLPSTPPYSLTGDLTYSKETVRFHDFHGKIGSSDLEGDLDETHPLTNGRPLITANLTSHHVDLADLAGFVGGTPGTTTTPGQNAATREKVEKAKASPYVLPHTPINLPKLKMANFEVHYKGQEIIDKNVPLDNVVVWLSIKDGRITLHPLNFAVGSGTIASNVDLDPVDHVLHTHADIDFRRIPLSRLMAATKSFAGSGTLGGSAHLVATGNSVAAMLAHGNGRLQLFLVHGGKVSALLADLAGLQVGDAILSALGIPNKTTINCLVSDFVLTDGKMDTKAFLISTPAVNILGSGSVNMRNEKLDLAMSTQATHFSIGSLSTPIDIHGTMKSPSVMPQPVPLAARAGAAVGLGVLFPPLALLPTIRLGLGDKNACTDTLQSLHNGHPHNP